jgi:hypothetical protein
MKSLQIGQFRNPLRNMQYRLSIENNPLQILLLLRLIIVQPDLLGQDVSEAATRLPLLQMAAFAVLPPAKGHLEWLVFSLLLLKTQF